MRSALILLAATVLLAGCSSGDADPDTAPAKVHQVSIHGDTFDPATLGMPAGDTLRFENHDPRAHTATSPGGMDTGDLAQGEGHEFQGMQAGTHVFSCRHHPTMRVTVTVT